jgi:uncharacterized protein with ATP-grasp and redox domains
MLVHAECLPCYLRQVIDTVRVVTDDDATLDRVLRRTMSLLSAANLRRTPPALSQEIYRIILAETRSADPYAAAKHLFNGLVLDMQDHLRGRIAASSHPMETAVRLVLAGNTIDFGIAGAFREEDLEGVILHALETPIVGSVEDFCDAVARAGRILYLADNAGEIVLDKLLIEQMPREKIVVAVRGGPIINDATMEDAEAVGLTRIVRVISNGSDAPGTLPDDCTEEFRREFDAADLLISKGQGNYESLYGLPREIVFLLKAKCDVVAASLGCAFGDLVIRHVGK